MTSDPDIDAAERDTVFIDRYLQYASEKHATPAVAACIDAGIKDYRFPISVIAERTLERLMPAINSVRKLHQPRPVTKTVTVDTLSQDMQLIYQEAKADRQYTAAIKAKEVQGKLHGLLTADGPTVNVNITTKTMTDAQLLKIAQGSPEAKTIDGEFTTIEPEKLTARNATKGLGSL